MRYVALLRGINVGGNKKVSMADLREMLSSMGHTDVSTYIQSGNARFASSREDSTALAQEIEERLEEWLHMGIKVLVRSRDELAAVIEGNPYSQAVTEPKTLHACFLSVQPDPERVEAFDRSPFAPDEFRVGDRVLYLRYPNGMGRSKLTHDVLERRLKVAGTTRNWNTVTKLFGLLNE